MSTTVGDTRNQETSVQSSGTLQLVSLRLFSSDQLPDLDRASNTVQ